MHPMILRPLFLPAQIRNASGNGGGVLVGYMVQVLFYFIYVGTLPDSSQHRLKTTGIQKIELQIKKFSSQNSNEMYITVFYV